MKEQCVITQHLKVSFSLIRRMTHTKIIVNLFDPTLVDVIDINKKEIEIEDDLLLLKDHATT